MKDNKKLPTDNNEETKQFDTFETLDTFDTVQIKPAETPIEEKSMGKKKKKQKKVNPNRKQAGKFTNAIAVLLGIMSSGFVIGVVVITVLVTSTIAESPKIDAGIFDRNDSTIILDANDNVIYDLGQKSIENVEYDEISQSLIDAFVSIEDSRFFGHKGFDIPRFANAMISNLISSITSLSLSFDAGGASTIDMQLIKNVVFTHEDTVTGESTLPEATGMGGIKRKINEIYLASKVNSDKVLDKKVIFQKYINLINFGAGGNTLGVQRATQFYFDKDVSELSLLESAFLAGVINAPNAYTPYNSIELATERTHTVLAMMKFHGYITDEEYDLATSIPLENIFVEQNMRSSDAYPNQAYIDIVLSEIQELTDLNPATTSMVIKTAMNPTLQAEYDRAQNREIDYLNIQTAHDTGMQLAATVINNETGEIIASFGGYDYYGQRIFNRSYDGLYQPGSTVKPLISYAPAYEYLGYSTSHVLVDEPYKWAGTDKELANWSRRYYGQVGILTAIAQSYNIPAVKAFDAVEAKIGIEKYKDYAEAIGFTRYADKLDDYFEAIGDKRKGRDEFSSQFAIGGSDFYTNTTELAGATAAIMNGGDYIKPHTIREVEIFGEQETVIKSPYNKTPVLSEAAAFLTAYSMRNVIDSNRYGVVERHVARNYPVYAKTGTSNWSAADARELNVPSGSGKDRLLLTATDKFSIASWTGFDPAYINKKDGRAYHSEALKSFQLQARINSFTLDSLERQYGPGQAIKQPSTVSQIKHILGTFPYQAPIEGMNPDLIATGYVKSDYASLAPATPPELEAFKGAKVEFTQENDKAYIDVTYEPYPDLEKLVKAPDTMELGEEGSGIKGARLYDPSWIFGPVRYTTEVYMNEELLETVKSEEDKQAIRVDITPGATLKVCTYYSFELNDDVVSKKSCEEFKLEEEMIEIPNFVGRKLPEIQKFGQDNGAQINPFFNQQSQNINDFLNITEVKSNLDGDKVPAAQLKNSTFNVAVIDFSPNITDYTPEALKAVLNQYIAVEISGTGTEILGIQVNEQVVPNFKLGDYYNQNITITILT